MSVRVVCPACGSQSGAEARFCPACGGALGDSAEGEVRKIVTIVFSDVASSTQLGEDLDPESLRRVMSRYFEEMQAVLERHGGVVEKFIGDAVMCVFGVPRAHEDDALRAVRAAVEMRDALAQLNEEFGSSAGVTLVTRTGLNTGEVVAGDLDHAQSLVAGDAVNVASRLENAAAPGEILIARCHSPSRSCGGRRGRGRRADAEGARRGSLCVAAARGRTRRGGLDAAAGFAARRPRARALHARADLRAVSGRAGRPSSSRSWAPPVSASRG